MTVVRDVVQPVVSDVVGSVMGNWALGSTEQIIAHFNGGAIGGGFWNIADTTSNNVAIDGTGADVTDTDPLGQRQDLSGNIGHLSAPMNDNRGSWDLEGEIAWDTHDGSNDQRSLATNFNASMRLLFAWKSSDSRSIAFNSDGGAFICASDGASTASTSHASGSPSYYIDNTPVTAQRNTLHAAANDGDAHVFEVRNIDMTDAGWSNFKQSSFGGLWNVAGKYGTIILYPEANITSAIRDDFYNFIAGQIGKPTI